MYKSELKVIKFINDNSNWRELLESAPYFLKIQDKDNYTLLMYNQDSSDFSNEIVQECRGLIIKNENGVYKPVCVPFYKFFNYGESEAVSIDWSSAKVLEKIDGSLIKLWYDDAEWHISSNGTIDASEVTFAIPNDKFKNYKELVEFLLKKDYSDFNFDINKIYLFELCSLYNKVVISYPEPTLYWLGTRDKITLKEELFDSNWKFVPKTYELKSLEDCISAAKELPDDEEGYVVVDKDFNRVKVKSPLYVASAHQKKTFTMSNCIDLVVKGETSEFLSYFPEFSEIIDIVDQKYKSFMNYLKHDMEIVDSIKDLDNAKEIALIIKDKCYAQGFAFGYLKGKYNSAEEYFSKLTDNQKKIYLELNLH